MGKNFFALILIFQAYTMAGLCPVSNNESRLEYKLDSSSWVVCDYRNGKLQSVFHGYNSSAEHTTYFPNGIPMEYHLNSQNSGGGIYIIDKKYNSSGMLISDYLQSSDSGYECLYAGNYQLKCTSFDNGIIYYAPIEYVSQYDWN